MKRELEGKDVLGRGGSAILGPDGSYLAGPLYYEEGILYAELEPTRLLEERQQERERQKHPGIIRGRTIFRERAGPFRV